VRTFRLTVIEIRVMRVPPGVSERAIAYSKSARASSTTKARKHEDSTKKKTFMKTILFRAFFVIVELSW
jgi:hypothetical protein